MIASPYLHAGDLELHALVHGIEIGDGEGQMVNRLATLSLRQEKLEILQSWPRKI